MSTSSRHPIRVALAAVLVVVMGIAGCARSVHPVDTPEPTTPAAAPAPAPPPAPDAADRPLATEPAQLADDLVADEQALRDASTPEAVLTAAAHRQQVAYRALGRHPEWDPVVRPRIPAPLLAAYDRNVDARRQLEAMSRRPREWVPAWRIVAPPPAAELLADYRAAEASSGVGWAYLAAINLIETAFGRVAGVSTAGAQGPMQFLPSTFASYSQGGDIHSPRDSIMAAGRFLAAHGFAQNRDQALYRYNNSNQYVRAVSAYAGVLEADPAAFAGYYRWEVYYNTTSGDLVLPVGYAVDAPMPVVDYLARAAPRPQVQMSGASEQVLRRLLGIAEAPQPDPSARAEQLSRQFLGTPYGANTLVGSAQLPERLVADLEKVDCFTYADYVEALKRAHDRDSFVTGLIAVRYKDGVVGFGQRRHFFTDWAAARPAVATDVTTTLGATAVAVAKHLNAKDGGGVYLPGLPVVDRTVSYLPSAAVDRGVVDHLRTGDYLGAYADDGGLDVTHVGIFVATPAGPMLRNASSRRADNKVVDTPLFDYLRTVPGIVVLRPVQ